MHTARYVPSTPEYRARVAARKLNPAGIGHLERIADGTAPHRASKASPGEWRTSDGVRRPVTVAYVLPELVDLP